MKGLQWSQEHFSESETFRAFLRYYPFVATLTIALIGSQMKLLHLVLIIALSSVGYLILCNAYPEKEGFKNNNPNPAPPLLPVKSFLLALREATKCHKQKSENKMCSSSAPSLCKLKIGNEVGFLRAVSQIAAAAAQSQSDGVFLSSLFTFNHLMELRCCRDYLNCTDGCFEFVLEAFKSNLHVKPSAFPKAHNTCVFEFVRNIAYSLFFVSQTPFNEKEQKRVLSCTELARDITVKLFASDSDTTQIMTLIPHAVFAIGFCGKCVKGHFKPEIKSKITAAAKVSFGFVVVHFIVRITLTFTLHIRRCWNSSWKKRTFFHMNTKLAHWPWNVICSSKMTIAQPLQEVIKPD
jgi:hypothetical protein